MEKITMTRDELIHLVEISIQLGLDGKHVIPDKKTRKKTAKWVVENTINDLKIKQ